jgi:hypothetical protein
MNPACHTACVIGLHVHPLTFSLQFHQLVTRLQLYQDAVLRGWAISHIDGIATDVQYLS